MSRSSLAPKDAQDIGLSLFSESFMGGTLAYCSKIDFAESNSSSFTMGSAFDRDSTQAISRAVGEYLERVVSQEICSSRGWALGSASIQGQLGAAFHFSAAQATNRAVAELHSRDVRANVWRQLLRANAPKLSISLQQRLCALTRRQFVVLNVSSDPRWLGLLSGSGSDSGVLFSDSYAGTESQRFSHSLREHLMLLAALASPRCTASVIPFGLSGVVSALTSKGEMSRSALRDVMVTVRAAPGYGLVAVATAAGWDGEPVHSLNEHLGAQPA